MDDESEFFAILSAGVRVEIEHGPAIEAWPSDDWGIIRDAVTGRILDTVPKAYEALTEGVPILRTPYEAYAVINDPAGTIRIRLAPKWNRHRMEYDARARVGGKIAILSRAGGKGIDYAPWTWAHLGCAAYRPVGEPADFYGGAPGWREAWRYAEMHMSMLHGVRL